MPTDPDLLRWRAARCRRLAARLDRATLHTLGMHATDDVWSGTAPEHCRTTWASATASLDHAARTLRCSARDLERRADEIDALRRAAVAGA